jgi:hypothetical protein
MDGQSGDLPVGQSRHCFAEPVIGRRFALTWLGMTVLAAFRHQTDMPMQSSHVRC